MIDIIKLETIKENNYDRTKTTVMVSKLYYLDNMSQESISEKLSVSKYMVRRLLKEARELGLIKIDIIKNIK